MAFKVRTLFGKPCTITMNLQELTPILSRWQETKISIVKKECTILIAFASSYSLSYMSLAKNHACLGLTA